MHRKRLGEETGIQYGSIFLVGKNQGQPAVQLVVQFGPEPICHGPDSPAPSESIRSVDHSIESHREALCPAALLLQEGAELTA